LLSRVPRLPGLDNRVMHTSYGNALLLKDTPEETTRKVMGMYTDPTRVHPNDPGHVEGNPLFAYHEIFNPDRAEVEDLERRYRAGTVGDVEVKQRLARVLNDVLGPLRERRRELARHPEQLRELLMEGTRAARPRAAQTLAEVYERMGLAARAATGDPLRALSQSAGAFC